MSGPNDTNTKTQPHLEELDLADVPDATGHVVPQASLLFVNGTNAGQTHPLLARETFIGRSPSAQVRIDEPGVSGKHAQLVMMSGQHVLVDLDSTNGTFLNGSKLEARQPVPLAAGDSIQVAETILAYVEGTREKIDPTRQLSRLSPAMPDTGLLRLPEAQLLAQLLQGTSAMPAAPPPPTLEERIQKIQRLLGILRQHWVVFFVAAALCMLAADATVFIDPPVSEATFRLRISPPKSKEAFEGQASDFDINLFYASSEQNFLGPAVVSETLRNLNKGKQPPEGMVNVTLLSMKFESVGEALYKGSFRHRDPKYAVTYLRRHLETFIQSEIKRSVHVAQAEVDFLSARLKETDVELERTEKSLQEFKSKHLEGLPENATGHIASRESLITRQAEAGAHVEQARLALDLARKQLAEEAPLAVKRGEGAEQYEKSLADVQRQLSELRSKGLGDSHPQVVALKQQAADLQRLADEARKKNASEFDRDANPGLVALRNRVGELDVAYRSAQAEAGSIGGLVNRLDSIVTTMPEVEAQYAELTRSYTATKDLHSKLFDKLRTNQLQLELERASAVARYEVMSPPESSGVPLKGALKMRSMIGFGLGLLVASLIVFFVELRRRLRHASRSRFAIIPVRNRPE
jgi:uncharacterized protein involved in exopolysaccharide biosynthesis